MRRDLGLLIMRTAVGATLAAHGAQKAFGWFGGGGLAGTGALFEQGGFRPGRPHATAAALSETGGGTLLALGLATPTAGAAVAGTMAVAADLSREKGFFNQRGGFEYPMTLGLTGLALSFTGAGRYSLDRVLGGRLARPWMHRLTLAGALAGSVLVVRRRRAQLAQPQPQPQPTATATAAVEGPADHAVQTAPVDAPVESG